jgi:hypothetical protein
MKAVLGISLHSYPYLNYQKCHVFLTIAYFYSSTELEKRAEQVLTGREGWGNRVGTGAGGRNVPNNVCTCEQMNNKRDLYCSAVLYSRLSVRLQMAVISHPSRGNNCHTKFPLDLKMGEM